MSLLGKGEVIRAWLTVGERYGLVHDATGWVASSPAWKTEEVYYLFSPAVGFAVELCMKDRPGFVWLDPRVGYELYFDGDELRLSENGKK
jgi:hypothetical protein